MRMRRIVICGPTGCTVFFPHYLINGTIFEKSYWIQNVCFDFLYNFCLKHLSFWEELSEMWSKMYISLLLHVKYRLLLSGFNETWIFLTEFRKILKYRISSKSVQWKPSLNLVFTIPERLQNSIKWSLPVKHTLYKVCLTGRDHFIRKPCFRMRTARRTDMTKLTVACRNFANAPKKKTRRFGNR